MIRTNKEQVRDTAQLSSSWCHSGTWFNYLGGTSTDLSGILNLAVKHEYSDGRVKIGNTYSYYGVTLMTWCMMKNALGRDGTGQVLYSGVLI